MNRERERRKHVSATRTDTVAFDALIADQLTKSESMIVVYFHLQLPGVCEEGNEIHQ